MSTPNAMTLAAHTDSVLVNELNLPSGIIYKSKSRLRNVKNWHKFIVSNTDGLSRNEVLQTILDHVHPLDLIPVFYAKDPMNSNSYFLARNCEAAIEKLCKDNLTIEHPYNKTSKNRNCLPFKINIILSFSNTNDVKIDVQKNVLHVLNRRFKSSTKTLDLDRFSADPELGEFCPLSQPKIMYFVLHIAKSLSPEEIILTNNCIKLLNPLDVLIGIKLRSIDMRNNEKTLQATDGSYLVCQKNQKLLPYIFSSPYQQLSSLTDLSALKHFHLKELYLDGNPLCNCDEDDYILTVRQLCPTVEILDGTTLGIDKFPVSKRYFFCDDVGYDLCNQFLEYYFSIYDTRDRKSLAGLYRTDAMFSLTCMYLANQISSATAFLKQYSMYSRNLKKQADFNRTEACLIKGRDNIMNFFETKLPLTEHDPFSFTVELINKTERRAVIVVTGVYHEMPNSLLDQEQLLGFTRTFVLCIIDQDSKYIITNDILHVYNSLTSQQRNSFLENVSHNKLLQREFLPKPQTKDDYNTLIGTLGRITGLKDEWSRKCLEEGQYDLKKSLELFVDLYKGDRIPKNAFLEESPEKSNSEKPKHDSLKPYYGAEDLSLRARNKDSNNNSKFNETRKQNLLSDTVVRHNLKSVQSAEQNNMANIQGVNPKTSQHVLPIQAGYKRVAAQRGLEIYEKSTALKNEPIFPISKGSRKKPKKGAALSNLRQIPVLPQSK